MSLASVGTPSGLRSDTPSDLYGYKEEEIEVLIDGENPGGLLPTKENIVRPSPLFLNQRLSHRTSAEQFE